MKFLLLWFFFAISFCAPMLIGWQQAQPSLHFDLYGMLWLTGMNEHLLESHHQLTSWPLGQDNLQLDSILLLWLANLCQAEQYPHLFMYLIAITGTMFSAATTHRLAKQIFDIPIRWAAIAGVLYGFQALYTVSILEGHLYLLWTFWLPLGWLCLDKLRKDPSPAITLCTVLCWLASLLTSAYIGVCCTLLYILYGITHRKEWNRQLTISTIILLCLGIFYSHYFSSSHPIDKRFDDQANIHPNEISVLEEIQAGSSTLSNLVVWTEESDLFYHSLAPTLGWMGICALIFGPWLLSGTRWRFAWLLSILSLLLSFGPFFSLTVENRLFPWILHPVLNTQLGSLLHFPIRFLFLTSLGTSMLIALMLHQLHQRAPKRIIALSIACLLETFIINGLPFRQGHTPYQQPTLYEHSHADFAVFDLLPRLHEQHLVENLRIKNIICSYQIEHRRILVNECLGKKPAGQLEEYLRAELLHGSTVRPWRRLLTQLGIGSIILHMDLWPPEKQEILEARLTSFFGQPQSSIEEGEYLLMWTLSLSLEDVNIDEGLRSIGFK